MSLEATWTLPLTDFKPTNINYTTAKDDSCLTCQDYDEVDTFARAVTLQKLQPLYEESTRTSTIISIKDYDPQVFDATILLKSIKAIAMPTKDSLMAVLTKQTWFRKSEESDTLRAIFQMYANYPIKSTADWDKGNMVLAKVDEDIAKLVKQRTDNKDTPELTRLRAKKDRLTVERFAEFEVYKWVNDTTRKSLVQKVAECLWLAFLKIKVDSAGFEYKNGAQIDYVARARLFHTWLSLSLTYDSALANDKKLAEKLGSDRPVANILSTGTEVCKGYADMFAQMFNGCEGLRLCEGINPCKGCKECEGVLKATSFSGRSRQNGGPQPYDYDSPEAGDTGHAWVAFPAFPNPHAVPGYKAVDPTWAYISPNNKSRSEDPWFSMSNSSMTCSHIPDNITNAYLPPSLTATTPQALWARHMPFLAPEGTSAQYWIDMSTIDPMRSWHTTSDPRDKTFSVSFRNNCKHQGPRMKEFYLGFRESKKSLKDFLVETFTVDAQVPFSQAQTLPIGTMPSQWNATLRFAATRQGWLFIYYATGVVRGVEQTCKRVALWQV